MEHAQQFFLDGKWVDPAGDETLAVINPATEEEITSIAMGGQADVDAAVAAARAAPCSTVSPTSSSATGST